MLSLDVLYYALAGGFLIFIAFLSFVLYELGKTIEDLRRIIEDIAEITHLVLALKQGLKFGFLSLVSHWLKGTKKGGGDDE